MTKEQQTLAQELAEVGLAAVVIGKSVFAAYAAFTFARMEKKVWYDNFKVTSNVQAADAALKSYKARWEIPDTFEEAWSAIMKKAAGEDEPTNDNARPH